MMMILYPQRSRHLTNHFSTFKHIPAKCQPFSSLSSLLGFCNTTQLLQQIHARFILHGLHQNMTISSELINRYGDISRVDFSQRVFESIADPDANLYHAIIKQFSIHGEAKRTLMLYLEMIEKSLYLDDLTFSFVTKSCSDLQNLETGRKIHCHVIKLGAIGSCVHLGAALVEMYLKFSDFSNAHQVIESMPVKNLVAWNALISGVVQYGNPIHSLKLFERMRLEGLEPDSVTIVSLLRSCVDLKCLETGKLLHNLLVVNGLGGDLSVSTALLMMYSKLGILEMARLVFDRMQMRDSVIWNVMISGYSQNGHPKQALELLIQMGKSGVRADLFTAIATLSSAAELKSLELGKQIHDHVIRHGSDYQVSVHNSLIEMYSKCKSLDYARKIFDFVRNKTVVTWSSMIKGYVNHDQFTDALVLFDEMRTDEVRLDPITVINVLPACVPLVALERVKNIHGYLIKEGFNSDNTLVTALLVTYAKCGCIEMAQKLFDEEEIAHKDTVSWNSMISAYSKHGNWSRCLELYSRMKNSKLKPDQLTFLGLLTSCVNSGLVKEGWECFNQMVETYGYRPDQEHYACMVDLLGRSGHLNEATKLIRTMPFEPDTRVWGPLLSACKLHSESKLGEFVAEKLIDMDPKNAGNYVLLSNIYAAAGKWDGVAKMRNFLRSRGLKKTPGRSWLEINGHVHEFRVADQSHPQSEDIYLLLRIMEHESKMDADMRT